VHAKDLPRNGSQESSKKRPIKSVSEPVDGLSVSIKSAAAATLSMSLTALEALHIDPQPHLAF
jgi:hypothetical protein